MSELSSNASVGLAISDINGKPITASGANSIMKSLSVAYRINYTNEEWSSFSQMLIAQAETQGWTEERFAEAAQWVALHMPWANLTLASFFDAPTPKLYGYAWYLERKKENPRAAIECFVVQDVALYREADGKKFPGLESILAYRERTGKHPKSL